jgi:organic hydroperoxide reductase OsmC/OhrA
MDNNSHTYHTSLRWAEQHRGVLSSPGLPEIAVATPAEFPGGHEGYWSPETLFVAAAEGCLMTTFLAIAKNSRLDFTAYESEADGVLAKTAEGFRITDITIKVTLTIPDESKKDRAERMIERAEHHCLISNSMTTTIHLDAKVVVG